MLLPEITASGGLSTSLYLIKFLLRVDMRAWQTGWASGPDVLIAKSPDTCSGQFPKLCSQTSHSEEDGLD